MREVGEDKFLVNYGWECVWGDPKNVYVKDYIKGPFAKPKLACSYPFATFCQMESKPSHRVNCECSQIRDLDALKEMFDAEDLGVVKVLNKGNHVGQGIPDPWSSYPFASFGDLKSEIRNYVCELLKTQTKKRRCLCCEKKYLFQCPDQSEKNQNCTCQDCHSKNGPLNDCGKDCRCIKILKKWVLENITSLVEKEEPDLGSHDKSLKQAPGVNEQGTNTDEKIIPKDSLTKDPQDNPKKTCFCSYLKSLSFRKKKKSKVGETYADFSQPVQRLRRNSRASKQIQTEVSLKKEPERLDFDAEQKCVCGVKQSRYTIPESGSHTEMMVSNICMPHLHIPNPAVVCPFSCDGVKLTKHRKHRSCQTKENYSLEKPNQGLFMYQPMIRDEHLRSSPASYDRLKFLTDIKLRNYLQRKELNSGVVKEKYKPLNITPRLSKLYEGDTPLGKIEIERLRPCLGNKRFDSAVQTTPRETKTETPTKITFLKDTVESDESRTYGLVRHCEGSCQSVRRRKKLLGGRKKRKKLSTNKSLVLVKPHKPNNQADRSPPGSPKKVSFRVSKEDKTDVIAPYDDLGEFEVERISKRAADEYAKQRHKTSDIFEEKASHNSRTSWSSTTLKSIVDGLLIEKPVGDYQKC